MVHVPPRQMLTTRDVVKLIAKISVTIVSEEMNDQFYQRNIHGTRQGGGPFTLYLVCFHSSNGHRLTQIEMLLGNSIGGVVGGDAAGVGEFEDAPDCVIDFVHFMQRLLTTPAQQFGAAVEDSTCIRRIVGNVKNIFFFEDVTVSILK